MKNQEIKILEEKIEKLEIAYRNGNPLVEDHEFDATIEELRSLSPKNKILERICGEVIQGEKIKIPVPMGSMKKIKFMEDLMKWISKYPNSTFMLSAKLDGISMHHEKIDGKELSVSRGDDGVEGVDLTERFKRCSGAFADTDDNISIRGELVIHKSNWEKVQKASGYKSIRSAVLGLISGGTPQYDLLKYVELVPFERNNYDGSKLQARNSLISRFGGITEPLPCSIVPSIESLTEEFLGRMYEEWSERFEIDGLIIEVMDRKDRDGFESNSLNPKWARAIKMNFEVKKDTTVIRIKRNISKSGKATPVAEIEPVILCGDTVTRINLDNDRFAKNYGIGTGSNITVKKSGNVIPRMTHIEGIKLLKSDDYRKLVESNSYVSPDGFRKEIGLDQNSYLEPDGYIWDDNGVFLTKKDEREMSIRKLMFFFKTMKIMDMGKSNCGNLVNLGYDTVEKVILMDHSLLLDHNGWGKKKVMSLKNGIIDKVGSSKDSRLMKASGFFEGLGESKITLILDGIKNGTTKTIDIDGMGEHASMVWGSGFSDYMKFYSNISHLRKKTEEKSGEFDGRVFCFTGFRNKPLSELIENNGGEYVESYSKRVTDLVCKSLGSMTKKTEKAKSDGKEIWDIDGLEKMIEGEEINKEGEEDKFDSLV